MSPYADPSADPAWLERALAHSGLSDADKAAVHGNPSLPAEHLIAALCQGSRAALHNPSLPLYLLTNPTADDGDGNTTTLRDAITAALTPAVARLASSMPRDGGLDVLRAWTFAAARGASEWWDDPDFVLDRLDMAEAWQRVVESSAPWGDLSDSAEHLVREAHKFLLGRADIVAPFLVALARDALTFDLPDGHEADVADVRRVADLLGLPPVGLHYDPRQLSLFDEVAA